MRTDALGVRGAHVIRVLIADEIARIVGDLEKLAPYGDVIDVCGVAHQASAVIEEAWLRQPDVLVLHEGFAELPPADFAAHLGSVSRPATHARRPTLGPARRSARQPKDRSSSKPSGSLPATCPPAVRAWVFPHLRRSAARSAPPRAGQP
jgi:hypothetical protein